MKKGIMILFSMVLLGMSTAYAAIPQNVGVVDIREVLKSSTQLAGIKADLKKHFNSREQALANLRKSLQTDVAKLRRDGAVMSVSDRKAFQKKLIKGQMALRNDQAKLQRDYMAARNKRLESLFKKVKVAVAKVAQSEKLDLVFVKSAVAYSSRKLDVTAKVVRQLH